MGDKKWVGKNNVLTVPWARGLPLGKKFESLTRESRRQMRQSPRRRLFLIIGIYCGWQRIQDYHLQTDGCDI